MGVELLFRTEDLTPEEVSNFYVATPNDRQIVEHLKSRSPILLRGSRGVGKSFLLRTAEAELAASFEQGRVLPVYVTFARAGLLSPDKGDFIPWMTAKISTGVSRALTKFGLTVPETSSLNRLVSSGGVRIDSVIESSVEEYRSDGLGDLKMPDSDTMRDALEDLCFQLRIARINLFVDEAAHVFVPEQQRQFFTLMRDLRSPRVAVKAAVYPGATSYGEYFQPAHDASVYTVERPMNGGGYATAMREIVLKQAPELKRKVESRGNEFDVLALAATGNPRILLKTVASSQLNNRNAISEVIRDYFRESIWSEHSALADRYPGHKVLIDWGREFMEAEVLPRLHEKNQREDEYSSAIWIHRDAPQAVKEALRLLCYSGAILEGDTGIRATRSEIGTRYIVNFGCNMAQDAEPLIYGDSLRTRFSIKRFIEFGANHPSYRDLEAVDVSQIERTGNVALKRRLAESPEVLDLTVFQLEKIRELELSTIKDVLAAKESEFQKLYYVGPHRSRQIRNAAVMAIVEYLSG